MDTARHGTQTPLNVGGWHAWTSAPHAKSIVAVEGTRVRGCCTQTQAHVHGTGAVGYVFIISTNLYMYGVYIYIYDAYLCIYVFMFVTHSLYVYIYMYKHVYMQSCTHKENMCAHGVLYLEKPDT